MHLTKLLMASALVAGIATSIAARPAAASVLYTVNGGAGFYSQVALKFETSTFISVPYTVADPNYIVTDPIECTYCTSNPRIVAYPSVPGVTVLEYPTGQVSYSLDFEAADFGKFGTYNDYYAGENDTLTVSEVPEPASLGLLAGGLLALAFVRRRGAGHPHTVCG